MNGFLLNRESGALSPGQFQQTNVQELLRALQPSHTNFERTTGASQTGLSNDDDAGALSLPRATAHSGGVNSIVIDRFDGRYLLSGGADASVAIWDLENARESESNGVQTYAPLAAVGRGGDGHNRGITELSFYPFDSLAFLSSSYDHTLKLWSSKTLQVSMTFNLESAVYAHAVSPIAEYSLVACATQHPVVRLVDLRLGVAAHAIPGHQGSLLSVAWSPTSEYLLASGGTDGTVRFWDIRRSASFLGCLDLEDSIGVDSHGGNGYTARPRDRGKAHSEPVNGIVWTNDGRHIVTTGHDEKIRVWDTNSYANTLANFGPLVKNKNLSQLRPCLASTDGMPAGKDVMFFPSEREILMFELFDGRLIRRLRPPGGTGTTAAAGKMTLKQRVIDLAWRNFDLELYSAHGNGTIQAWKPRVKEDAILDEEERLEDEAEAADRDKKRKVLEDIYQDFARKRVDFGR